MLYLAEVKSQNRGFVGGYKTELKLLASQASDQSWSIVSGNSFVTVENVNDTATTGTLYIINLNDNKQPQSAPELAGARVVNYLRQLSRLLEKSKSQESEIEEWKDSLKLQGEQIALRQNELDQQQQVISQQQQESAKIEQEKEQLGNAWEELRKEQARSKSNKEKIQILIQNFAPGEGKIENLPDLLTVIDQQQQFLDNYWQQLESDRNNLPTREEELKTKQNHLNDVRQQLDSKQEQWQQSLVSAKSNHVLLREKEEKLKQVQENLRKVKQLEDEVALIADDSDDHDIDLNALENMSLSDLETTVNELQQETSKLFNFVNAQEEELSLQTDEVRRIEHKIGESTEVEKFSLESELADAQEAMKLLDETLVGQRKTLKKQQHILNEHLKILTRRKGVTDIDFTPTINTKPLTNKINGLQTYFNEQMANLTSEVAQLQLSQNQLDEQATQREEEYQEQKRQSQEKEKELLQIYQQVTETECNVSLLEQILETMQEQVKTLADSLKNFEPNTNNIDVDNLINELKSML